MWPSTSSSRAPRARGFTLLEAMISLLLLVIVLIVAMTMLFQMRAFAERQQYFMLPRQAARRATDYLSYYIAGASDLNYVKPLQQSPNALITYYNLGNPAFLTQASYNNLTGNETNPGPASNNKPLVASGLRPANTSTEWGDIGTDIITMVAPFNPSRYQVVAPFAGFGTGKDLSLNFRVGCGTSGDDDAANMKVFRAATGFDGTQSALLMLVDINGNWSYVRIPDAGYDPADAAAQCSLKTGSNIRITVDTASAATNNLPAPPHGGVTGFTDPVYLVAGLQVISFRVLTDSVDGIPKLQQKLGLFDPSTDNPYPPAGNPVAAFTNVLENVEDLQVAYVYARDAAAGGSGLVWNTASQTIATGGTLCPTGCDTHVPFQAGPAKDAPPLDIQNVIGLRFSVTGRSPLLPIGARKLTTQHFRPASEDHAGATVSDQFDHYRATATLMLRNRIPRG
jgi:type II secretory pathway pseudopilin PulG